MMPTFIHLADMKKVIELDPSNDQARRTIRRLEPLAAEKREKMKEEMIGMLMFRTDLFVIWLGLDYFSFDKLSCFFSSAIDIDYCYNNTDSVLWW